MNRLALVLPLVLWGCTISDIYHGGALVKTSSWYDTGEVRKSRDEIARTVRELLLRQGYGGTDFEGDALETPWDTHLSPLFREGYRTKVEARIVPLASGGFNVRVRSTMEINNSQSGTMAEQADWIGAGASEKHKDRIADDAVKLHSMLKMRFFGLNP
jgi:hypothetical protein